MALKKTHETFIEEMNRIHPNIDVLSHYTSAHNKVHCKCRLDGYQWDATPNALLKGSGCARCHKKERITSEEFIARMHVIHPSILVLGDYKNRDIPVLCKCLIDGHEWHPRPHHLLKGVGCPRCAGVAKKTMQDFVAQLKCKAPHIRVLEEYKKNKSKLLCECQICGHRWKASPNALLCGHSNCPACNNTLGESRIMVYLQQNHIAYSCQHRFSDCRDKLPMPFDFYLPDLNTVVEYDGQQHFVPIDFGNRPHEESIKCLVETQRHDTLKNEYCDKHGIKLIRIPYTDFDNIEAILDKQLL